MDPFLPSGVKNPKFKESPNDFPNTRERNLKNSRKLYPPPSWSTPGEEGGGLAD